MRPSAQSIAAAVPGAVKAPARPNAAMRRPFCGMIDAVLVDEPVLYPFAGSVVREGAMAAWTWIARDLCPDLISADAVEQGTLRPADLEPVIAEILIRAKRALAGFDADNEAMRRFRAQFGRDNARDELNVVLAALRARMLLGKAQGFGKAVNAITDDGALGAALQSIPLSDPQMAALFFHAAVGQVANPTRLIAAAIKLSGNAKEATLARTGFTPLLEACLAHAQNQLHHVQLAGPFADVDLVCRGLDRFHRLVRALTGYIEFERGSRATQVLSTVTKLVSDRIEPRLKEVATDLNQAMRRPREGADRIDNDRMLAAISGVYLLSAVRDCRDSLALNAVFDQAWSQSGQALELHIQRNLDLLRRMPGDAMTGLRLDAAIKMAEVRFNADYAETLKRARIAAERRG